MATTDERDHGAQLPKPPKLTTPPKSPTPAWQRLAWFVALWAAGAGVLWVISLLIRWAVVPA